MGEGDERPVSLIGAPVEAGTDTRGCAMGPAALRTAGIVRQLEGLGRTVVDWGDLKPSWDESEAGPYSNVRNWAEVAAWTREIGKAVEEALEASSPIVLGGDHSLSMGTVNGVARHCRKTGQQPFVLWLDAHADYNVPATSPSGNLHGMPVAAFCGEPELHGLFKDGDRVPVSPADVHLFGIRSVDPGEQRLLKARGIDVVDMRVIDENGVAAPLKRILDRIAERDGFLHVSLDVDFLDPAVAPGVGTTVPGGATYREAHLILEMLHDSGLVGSVDLVELNLFLDEHGRTATLMTDLVASLFGRKVFDRPTPGAVRA